MNMNNIKKSEYDSTILVFRLIAIISVVICHIGTEINNNVIAQFFNVGVQFFLFISGYLYANRMIDKPIKWLCFRYVRITVPCIIYVTICIIISITLNWNFSNTSVILYFLNLEGYYHAFEFISPIELIMGTQHLWFVTVLFFCYFIMLFIKKYENKIHNIFIKKRSIGITWIVVFFLSIIGVRADYILTFFIGYYIGRNDIVGTKKNVLITMLFMILFGSIRLIMKRYCDLYGDNIIYTQIIIPIVYIAITIFTFFFLNYCFQRIRNSKLFDKIIKSSFIKKMNDLSFYIYVSHYILLGNELSIFKSEFSFSLSIVIFIVEVFFAGILLQIVSKLFIKCIEKILIKHLNY